MTEWKPTELEQRLWEVGAFGFVAVDVVNVNLEAGWISEDAHG